MSCPTTRVAVFGAGIAGLTVAHELLENTQHQVHLFESSDSVGGMAKTRRVRGVPTEHSWRGYFAFYRNLFKVMGEIPLDDRRFTAQDNVSEGITFRLLGNTETAENDLGPNMTDRIRLGYGVLKVMAACPTRRLQYHKVRVVDSLALGMSVDGRKELLDHITGPGFGMDRQTASIHHFVRMAEMDLFRGLWKSRAEASVLKGPTSEMWLEPWFRHLQRSPRFTVYLEHQLQTIQVEDNRVVRVNVRDLNSATCVDVKDFQWFVFALNPFSMRHVLQQSVPRSPSLRPLLNQHTGLVQHSVNHQVAFTIGFHRHIKFPSATQVGMSLVDSEYNITMYPQDRIWHQGADLGPQIQSLWSGTCVITHTRGRVFGKPATQLNRDQMKQEIWAQILAAHDFTDFVARNNAGLCLAQLRPDFFEIWSGWKVRADGKLGPDYVKWVNNIYNERFRPQACVFDNMMLVGAHTQTKTGVWSMEAACESGRHAAAMMAQGQCQWHNPMDDSPLYMNVLKALDEVMMRVGLPNIVDVIIVVLLTLLMLGIVWLVFN